MKRWVPHVLLPENLGEPVSVHADLACQLSMQEKVAAPTRR